MEKCLSKGENTMENNLMIFKNIQVEIFEQNGKILFNPKHVAECLELSEDARRKQIQRMNDKQTIVLKNSDVTNCLNRKLNNRGESFLKYNFYIKGDI